MMRNSRVLLCGYVLAFATLLLAPVVPLAMAAPAQRAAEPDLPAWPDTLVDFWEGIVDVYDAVFGVSDPTQIGPLDLIEPVTGPGSYVGFDKFGAFFSYEVVRFEPVQDELGDPTLSNAAMSMGYIVGNETVYIVALTAEVIDGLSPLGESNRMAILGAIEQPDEMTVVNEYDFINPDGTCNLPNPNDPCFYICAICPNGGGLWCPWCDPSQTPAVCAIEQAYENAVEQCWSNFRLALLAIGSGGAASILACLLKAPVKLWCIVPAVAVAVSVAAAVKILLNCLNSAQATRNAGWNGAFLAYCSGVDEP